MIEKITIKANNPRFEFSDYKTFYFKPGLNLITGANTSGKSSLLNMIRLFNRFDTFMANEYQSFKKWSQFETMLKEEGKVFGKISKTTEYRPQVFKETSDFSFAGGDFSMGRALASKFQSSGEGRTSYHEQFVSNIQKKNSFSKEDIEFLKENKFEYDNGLLIIADEPENSMAINMQFGLFEWFLEWCEAVPRLQVIIATHSIAAFALANNPKINFIEMNKGWKDNILDKCKPLFE